MPTRVPSTAARKQKIYRFALYGRKNSGKTSILAALAMDRLSHPAGLNCTWIDSPAWVLEHVGGNPGEVSENLTSFIHGKEWLEQAIGNLTQGEIPPPNRNDKDVFRFLYKFTAAEHPPFLAELIDYSGELIDPDVSDTDLAKCLRQHMLMMDGILVLAEAPHPGQPLGELSTELNRLKQAFATLRGEKQDGPALDVPVALLMNKWDHRTQREDFSFANSDKEVAAFLNSDPEPPHRRLVDTLRGSVTADNFRVFPVSAFGKCLTIERPPNGERNGSPPERPAQVNPLCSFGLEDGFVWACRRRDEIDIGEFETDAATRTWLNPIQLLARSRRGSLATRGSELKRRFPAGSGEHRRVGKATAYVSRAFFGQWVVTLATAVVLAGVPYVAAGAIIDYCGHGGHRPTLDNLQAADKHQLAEAEHWLETYIHNAWFWHVGYRPFYGADAAAGHLVAIRERRKTLYHSEWHERWQEIQKTPDPVTQEGLARKLRDDMLAAPHADDAILAKCNTIIEQSEADRKTRDNETALHAVEADFNNLLAAKVEDREEYRRMRRRAEELPMHKDAETKTLTDQRIGLLQRINNRLDDIEKLDVDHKNTKNTAYIADQERQVNARAEVADLELVVASVKRGLPHREVASSDIQQRYTALALKAQAKLDDAVRRRDWLKFEDEYHQLVRGGNLRGAAQRLVEKAPEPELEALKKDFRHKCMPQTCEKKDELIRGKQWKRGRDLLKVLRTDKYVKTLLLDDDLWKLEDMEHDVNVAADRHLYGQLQNRKTRTHETIQRYLADAPLKTMKKKVEDYRHYLKQMEDLLNLEIESTILWGGTCWQRENTVVFNVDGEKWLDKTATSKQNDTSSLGSEKLKRKLADKINLNIDIQAHTRGFLWIGSTRNDNGRGTFEGRISDLLGGGKTVSLDNFGNRVVLRILEPSLPREPALLEWRE